MAQGRCLGLVLLLLVAVASALAAAGAGSQQHDETQRIDIAPAAVRDESGPQTASAATQGYKAKPDKRPKTLDKCRKRSESRKYRNKLKKHGKDKCAEPLCPGNLTQCGSLCVDTNSNITSCGSCFYACNSRNETCANGTCVIKPPSRLSLQVKYAACLIQQASNPPQPTLLLSRVDSPAPPVCSVNNSQAMTSSSSALFITPPPLDSICTAYNASQVGVRYKVDLDPQYADLARIESVVCYNVNNPQAPVDITNKDGSSFTAPAPPADVTCVATLQPGPKATVDPGYWTGSSTPPTCTPCGVGYACPGDGKDRYKCPEVFLTTTTATSTTCDKPYVCNPCPAATPDVFLSIGGGGKPPNSVWWIRSYSDTTNLEPVFLCQLQLAASEGQVGDLAMLWTGELVFVTTSGNIYTLAASDVADYVKNPDPNLTRQCASLTFVVALPKVQGTTYSGLGIGFQSNVLLASTSAADALAFSLATDTTGALVSSINTQVNGTSAPCDPALPDPPGSVGGTDITAHPDGSVYRWCAKDTNTKHTYAATKFTGSKGAPGGFDFSPTTVAYSNRNLTGATYTGDDAIINAGAFCTSSSAIGVGFSSIPGSEGGSFYRMDVTAYAYPGSPPGGSWLNLPPAPQVASTVVNKDLRVNGATVRPVCQV